MFFYMAITYAIASSLVEWIVYYQFPGWLRFTEGKPVVDLITGSVLSIIMSKSFGAEGVTIALSAGFSLVLSWMGMPIVRKFAYDKSLIPHYKAEALKYANNIKMAILITINVILFIPRLTMKIYRGIKSVLGEERVKKIAGYIQRIQTT